ncbi:MAG: hypothetical protein IJM66_04865 [Muribaculaceae bacterium]|nr:hypothetical protein [Muribaculaceae bacterium]
MGDCWWANNHDGKIVPVDHHDDMLEMIFRWQIDMNDTHDPFLGPTEEALAKLKRCREQHVQEMIDMGVDIAPGTWPPTQAQEDEFERLQAEPCQQTENAPFELPF